MKIHPALNHTGKEQIMKKNLILFLTVSPAIGILLNVNLLQTQVKIHNNERYDKPGCERYFLNIGITMNMIHKAHGTDMVCRT